MASEGENETIKMTLLAASLVVLSLLPTADSEAQASAARGPATAPAMSRLPAARRPQYEVFARKCSRCHDLERALSANFSAGEWETYLRRKNRRAGAGITAQQSREIAAFLRYWTTQAARGGR